MKYIAINSNTVANPYVYAISLDSFVPPNQLKQRFSRATSIQINFSNETTTDIESYLQALCDTISFKSFHFSAHQLPLLPATLWTNELISFVLKVKEKSNVSIEPPLDFENHLKEIEIVGASHIAPNLFDTPTVIARLRLKILNQTLQKMKQLFSK
jgi:hypothetical protein